MEVVLVILIAFFFVLCFGGRAGLFRQLERDKKYQPIRNSDGYFMLDDMRLDENQIKLFYGTDKSGAANVNRWPNGVIPYKYSSQIPFQIMRGKQSRALCVYSMKNSKDV